MKKAALYIYVAVAVLLIPVIIGLGVADLLVRIYDNLGQGWIVYFVVCILTGAVCTWFPMLLAIENTELLHRGMIFSAIIVGWFGGICAPIIIGFHSLGKIITVLLIITTLMTVSTVLENFKTPTG